MKKLTENGYAQDIKRKCEALDVWRPEFERSQRRLAKIYVRIDEVEDAFERSGGKAVIKMTKGGAEKPARNPYIVELDLLYDQALTYERELGLTAAALKKINESALKTRAGSPMDELAKVLSMA